MTSENNGGDLARRKHALLIAIVEDYVAGAEPVGSRHIVREHSLGVRAATVRAMMGTLEDDGFLVQPHTSAGRIPTDKAFRYYVDHLIPNRQVSFQERSQIEYCYSERARDLNEMMRDTSRLLSMLTGQTALVLGPKLEAIAIERVSFIPVRPRTVLALFVAVAGGVHNRLVDTSQDYTREELDRMAAYLNDTLEGRTLEFARRWIEQALKEERARYDRMVGAALTLGDALVQRPSEVELYVQGSARAVEQPEFSDPAKLRELLRTLEDKTAILDLLERTLTANRPTVSIGSENTNAHLSELSVVAAAYASGTKALGSLAVLGPVRMDYGRVIPLVDYTAKALSKVFEPSA
jgi:heat-inducible transcriptional repressor